jgi:hypothetical protein
VSSSVTVAPDRLAAAAKDVAGIGFALTEANATTSDWTTAVVAAAEDEVSAAIAEVFSGYGHGFQALSAHAARFHSQFAQTLRAAGGAYASAETVGLSSLKNTLGEAFAAAAPNLSISIFGVTLVQIGNAVAHGNFGDVAIAYGSGSTAFVTTPDGVAVAAGYFSHAEANGRSNAAFAIGVDSLAEAVGGHDNIAISYGELAEAGARTSDGRNLAVALGYDNRAFAVDGHGNVAGAFGGQYNRAVTGGGSHNVAIVDGAKVWGGVAEAHGNGVVTIVPEGAEPNLGISIDGMNVVELGNAHVQSGVGDVAIAYGDESQAAALGGESDIAIAFGTGTHSVTRGSNNAAFAFGNYDSAEAEGDVAIAGVLDGDQSSATASGYRAVALVLEGPKGVAVASGDYDIDIYPHPRLFHSRQ